MIDHRSLLFYAAQLQQVGRYTPESVTVSWLPNFHDYGLVQSLLEPIYSATPSYSDVSFRFRQAAGGVAAGDLAISGNAQPGTQLRL